VFENGAEENMWTQEGLSNGRMEEVAEWGELHNLYSSPVIIRQTKSGKIRWAWHVACMGQKINVYKVFMEEPEAKRPFGRLKGRWDQDGSYRDWLGECGMDSPGSG
jgi:hypothetical protein